MEETVEKLEAMFDKAECDLDFIHRKLEDECAAKCDGPDEEQANPVQVLNRISEIKGEFQAIVEDAKEIQKAQQEAMLFFRDKLSSACTALMHLQTSSGLEAEKPEELAELEDFLGISVPNPLPTCKEESHAKSDTHNQTETTTSSDVSIPQKIKEPVNVVSHKEIHEIVDMSPHAMRSSSDDFIEVTQNEFETVSSLIRGRVKLPDVNQTYQILWQHFKENPESDPLTPTDLHKMELRVTGKTGDAKLKVLRALKLLAIAKNGNVKIS